MGLGHGGRDRCGRVVQGGGVDWRRGVLLVQPSGGERALLVHSTIDEWVLLLHPPGRVLGVSADGRVATSRWGERHTRPGGIDVAQLFGVGFTEAHGVRSIEVGARGLVVQVDVSSLVVVQSTLQGCPCSTSRGAASVGALLRRWKGGNCIDDEVCGLGDENKLLGVL